MADNNEALFATPGEGYFRLADTDQKFALHWKSGSLKYTNFKPMMEGGTAKLFSCFDENLRRTVVYKTLHDHLREDEIETQRFLREARVTANISHPGTVPLYELGRDRNGNLFFTMKHVRGRDLRNIIESIKGGDERTAEVFPLAAQVDILISVCQTVAYAHRHGVIHRDLKPANILVGGFGEALVIDWGLAKVWGEPELATDELGADEDPALTPVGRRYGTPLYMAPELARGDAHIDARVDVFSLGNVLFEILTHQQMLSGETVSEVTDRLLNQPLLKPGEVAPEKNIPPALETICLRALEKEPKNRYHDVTALMEALQKYHAA
ncbi:MAG: serine/threonine protein kinase [Verrucomicrobia subdivision 3 bacterium]|nr:serine/threonine protein kinase [Limisphaerales bacterium]